MLSRSLPKLDVPQLESTISKIEPLKQPVAMNVQVEEKGTLRAFATFDDHRIELVGFSAPVPPSTLERTITVSNWKRGDKKTLQSHRAHIICYYEGENSHPTEQLLSLYKTSFAFSNLGLLGVLDEEAWNCMPVWMIKEQMIPKLFCHRAMREVSRLTEYPRCLSPCQQIFRLLDQRGVDHHPGHGESAFALSLLLPCRNDHLPCPGDFIG